MRKLQSLVNIMNDPKSSLEPANLGAEGIGVKDVGFAQFSSPKKRNGGTSFGTDGFAEIANKNKKKRSQSTNVGEEESQVRRKEGFESTKTPIAEQTKVRLKQIVTKKKHSKSTNVGQEERPVRSKEVFESTKTTIEEAGFPNQAKNRRFKDHGKNQSGLRVPTQSGEHIATESGPRVPTQSGLRVPTQSGEHVATQSGPQLNLDRKYLLNPLNLDCEYLPNLHMFPINLRTFALNLHKVFLLNLNQDQIYREYVDHLSPDSTHR